MKDKILKLLSRLRAPFEAVGGLLWQAILLLKWPLLFFFGSFSLMVASALGWSWWHPATQYRDLFVKYIQESVPDGKVHIKKLKWIYSLPTLSVGISAEDVRIEGSASLQELTIPKVSLSTEPFKLIFGRVPLKIEAQGAKLRLRASADKVAEKGTADIAEGGAPAQEMLPPWFAYLRANVRLDFDEISLDPQSVGHDPESKIALKKTSVDMTVSGLPGHFTSKIKSELGIDLERPDWSGRGPVQVQMEGYFQVVNGRPAGVRIGSFKTDLSETTVTGLGMIEKTSVIPVEISSELQILLEPNLSVKSVEWSEGELRYDTLRLSFSGNVENNGKLGLRWIVGKTEVNDLRLPFVGVRDVPVEGIFETGGQLVWASDGSLSGNWRIGINNMKLNTSEFPRGDSGAKGQLKISFMSEGIIETGRVSSPRTELQIDGTDAEINLFGGKVRKPVDKAFEVIVKAGIRNDKLTLSRIYGAFHTMTIEGAGEVNDITAFLSGQSSPFKISLFSNRVDIAKYATFLPHFRRPPPLEGFIDLAGSIEGNMKREGMTFDDIKWRIDHITLSNFKAIFERESIIQFGLVSSDYTATGAFGASLLFQGRGKGFSVDHALLTSQVDLTNAAVLYQNRFRKPVGVPFVFDVSADQTRQVLKIQRGNLRFHDLELNFDGKIIQGSSKGFVEIRMPQPIRLSNWKDLILDSEYFPVDGLIKWSGRMGFATPGSMESNLDWKTLSIEGIFDARDVRGRFASFKNPIRNGQIKLILASDAFEVPAFNADIGGTRAFGSGKLVFRPNAQKGRAGNIAKFLTRDNWDIDAALSLTRLDPSDFDTMTPSPLLPTAANVKEEEPSFGQRFKEMLRSPWARSGRAKISLRAATGTWHDLGFQDFNARVQWQEDKLRIEPLGARVFGGSVSGSTVFDAERFFVRKENPEFTASLKAEGTDVALAAGYFNPKLGKLVSGKFNGALTLVSQGWELEELGAKMRGRMTGRLRQGSFDSIKALDASLGTLFQKSAARDYLHDGRREACLADNFDGDLDLQLTENGLQFEKADLSFASGSSLELKGKIKNDLNTDFEGTFFAGPKCIGGDARMCLASGTRPYAALPFTIQGPASNPGVNADVDAVGRKIASCVADRVAARAAESIRRESKKAVKGTLDEVERKATDALKGAFQAPVKDSE